LALFSLLSFHFELLGQGLFVRSADVTAYRQHILKDDGTPPKDGAVRVTFLGTATLLFDDGETQLLTDGFLTRPAARQVALGPIATDPKVVDAALDRAKASRVKALFVGHSHYDHALDSAYVAKRTRAVLHGSASTLNVGRGGGVPEKQMVQFRPGQEYTVGRFRVTVFAGRHSPPIPGLNDDLGRTIDAPLKQPAVFTAYKEGGSFDFLIRHDKLSVLVNPAGNAVPGEFKGVRADVLFLSVGALDLQTDEYRDAFYANTVGTVRPRLVVPIHWDNFLTPLSDKLDGLGNAPASFDFLLRRLKADGVRFGLLRGFGSFRILNAER
jgi:L-ascorbate metabolism protein UlaG (beta-lactamase superfamily)